MTNKRSLMAHLILVFASVTALSAGDQTGWAYFGGLPDGRQVVIQDMPGQLEFAREESTKTLIPLYSPEQAARIAIEIGLLLGPEDSTRFIVPALAGMRSEDGPLQSGGDGYDLCLRLPTVEFPIHIEVPGSERYVIRTDGGRMLLFTVDQARVIYDRLIDEGFTRSEAATVLVGFRVEIEAGREDGAKKGTVLAPACGFCHGGSLCEKTASASADKRRGCCSGGGNVCQACTICPLKFSVYLPFEP